MSRIWPALFAVAILAIPSPAKDADPDPKSLDVPAETDTQAREWVSGLGNSSFADREQANRDLKALGRLALPALRDALANNSSPEVQLRCEMLLPRATSEDFKARVDCFLADGQGRFEHKLPGAKQFFAVAGQSEASRNVFRDIVLSPNQALLFAIGGTPEDLAKAIANRRNQFRPYYGGGDDGTGRGNPKALDMAAILFAESFVPEAAAGPRNGTLSTQYLNQPDLRAALDAPATKEVYTSILTKWIDTREVAATLYSAMVASTNLKLPTAMKCAKKLLDLKGAPGSYRGMAMTAIAKNGTPADIALLEPFLKDNSLIINTIILGGPGGNKRIAIQARDTALALVLLMQKKDPTEYGMTSRIKNGTDIAKLSYSYHFFDDADMDADKKRDAAVKKYEEWKAEDKDKKKD